MNIEQLKHIYFIGIGGIGMSSLARWFNQNGKTIYGYDSTSTPLTDELLKEGMKVTFEDEPDKIPSLFFENPDESLVIYTPAIPPTHLGKQLFISKGVKLFKRSEVLGHLSNTGVSLAVAGTHGKTTTSSILAHLLNQSGAEVTAFLGGILVEENTNSMIGEFSDSTFVVSEADEFDRSFLRLFPNHAIITSCDADHLDIYGDHESLQESFLAFINQIKNAGLLIIHENAFRILSEKIEYSNDLDILIYGTSESCDIQIKNISYHCGLPTFDILGKSKEVGVALENCQIRMQGNHNIFNASAAAILALKSGLTVDQVKEGLKGFRGIKRRFELINYDQRFTLVDDYAHHPEEIKCFIEGAKSLEPNKPLTIVFQPHLFSRTNDFANDFANSLRAADHVLLMDIYPARELPIKGVTSHSIGQYMKAEQFTYVTKENLLETVHSLKPKFLATVGAGDISNFVEPLKKLLDEIH